MLASLISHCCSSMPYVPISASIRDRGCQGKSVTLAMTPIPTKKDMNRSKVSWFLHIHHHYVHGASGYVTIWGSYITSSVFYHVRLLANICDKSRLLILCDDADGDFIGKFVSEAIVKAVQLKILSFNRLSDCCFENRLQ